MKVKYNPLHTDQSREDSSPADLQYMKCHSEFWGQRPVAPKGISGLKEYRVPGMADTEGRTKDVRHSAVFTRIVVFGVKHTIPCGSWTMCEQRVRLGELGARGEMEPTAAGALPGH